MILFHGLQALSLIYTSNVPLLSWYHSPVANQVTVVHEPLTALKVSIV